MSSYFGILVSHLLTPAFWCKHRQSIKKLYRLWLMNYSLNFHLISGRELQVRTQFIKRNPPKVGGKVVQQCLN